MALNKLNVDKNKVYIGKTWGGGVVFLSDLDTVGIRASIAPRYLLIVVTGNYNWQSLT